MVDYKREAERLFPYTQELRQDLRQLKAAEKNWQKEREEIADQIDAAIQKLEDIQS